MNCRVCHRDVPSGEFCGNCGATSFHRRGDGPDHLRLSAHAAAPTERVLSPAVTSTLFPALPRHSRPAFRLALIIVVALLFTAALTKWQAPLIGLVVFGLPLVFVVYLYESDGFADIPALSIAVTAVLGIGLGIAWALATDSSAANTDDDALGLPPSPVKILIIGLAVPLGFLLALYAPIVIVRVWRPGTRESLSGFAIGSLSGFVFAGAGSLTRLVSEFANGVIDEDGRPAIHLLIAGAIQGVAIPLTAAAVGGAVGATLWFRRRDDAVQRPSWYALTSPVPAIAFGVALYLVLALLDFFPLPNDVVMAIYALLGVVALYAVRLVVHATLLQEAPDAMPPDAMSPESVVLCPQCEHVVPDLPFCPSCGIAANAGSRSSRSARRATRPVPVGGER